jgi:hypothetical protein
LKKEAQKNEMALENILFRARLGGGFAVSLPYCACCQPKMTA